MDVHHRILFISTDKNWAEMYCESLLAVGSFDPQVASLPDEAIDILVQNRRLVGNFIQCIILDMTPHNELAFQFVCEWQKRESFFKHIPIIGITTNDDIARWDKSMESRLSYYMYAPVDPKALLKVLDDIVIKKQLKKYTDITKHLGRYRLVAPKQKLQVGGPIHV